MTIITQKTHFNNLLSTHFKELLMLSDEIMEIIADVLEITPDELDEDTRLEAIVTDELSLTDIASALEDQYSIEISEDALESFSSVEDIVSFVTSNLD